MTLPELHTKHEEENAKNVARDLAAFLDSFLNGELQGEARKTGFILMMFPFGDVPGRRANWITNGADKNEIVRLMKETISRFEMQNSIHKV